MPSAQETVIFVIFIGFIIAFLIYYGISTSVSINRRISAISNAGNESRNKVVIQRLTGFLCFFVIPAAIVFTLPDTDFRDLGLIPKTNVTVWQLSLLIALPLVLLSTLTAKSTRNLSEYPQIRNNQWNSGLLIISALTWILYLFAYEFTFRGFLFFSLIEPLGLMPAIAVNTCIYALVHVPKSFREAVGSIPLGIILCLAVWKTDTFMVAFISHCFLALSNEWLSLYHHPSMKLKRNNSWTK